jgi:hypothetical protein
MNSLKWFSHDQIEEACRVFHDLLLLLKGDVDRRAEHLPQIHLSSPKYNPTINRPNYSFLQDPRNEKAFLAYHVLITYRFALTLLVLL